MRKNIVAGNWKMNTSVEEGVKLAGEIGEKMKDLNPEAVVIVAPPFTHLSRVADKIKETGSLVALAAQNCAENESGAYTGEVSAKMLAELSCEYVILGHSERREYYGEINATLNNKIKMVLENGMKPIFCVGERLEERESGEHFEVVSSQIKEVLFNLNEKEIDKVVVAYEPVWAIGTGKTASADQAEEIHAFIRKVIAEKFPTAAAKMSILYGGSCKPSNAREIFSKKNVDGGLIGGASLKSADFVDIVDSF
jgi:triosephosphate isomerase